MAPRRDFPVAEQSLQRALERVPMRSNRLCGVMPALVAWVLPIRRRPVADTARSSWIFGYAWRPEAAKRLECNTGRKSVH
jgi:hypothetical protein